MSEAKILALFFDVMAISSLFSVIGALIYLALKTRWIPILPNFDWQSAVGRFAFSVGSGVCTWFFTDFFFGVGVEEVTATSITTALVIGAITTLTGYGEA